jgi:hypothetical protein
MPRRVVAIVSLAAFTLAIVIRRTDIARLGSQHTAGRDGLDDL